jgi:hypothetical protein
MAAGGSGALPGDSLAVYIGNFCSEALVGEIQVWWYIKGHCTEQQLGYQPPNTRKLKLQEKC